jgi:hypothetical protein
MSGSKKHQPLSKAQLVDLMRRQSTAAVAEVKK